MRRRRATSSPAFLAGFAMACALLGPPLPARAAPQADVVALVAQVPDADPGGKHTGPDPAEAGKAYQAVLQAGKESVLALAGMLVEPGKGNDYKARYFMHGMAIYATAPGREADRRMMCEALAGLLGGAPPKAVQAYLLQELQHIGRAEAVPAIEKVLGDEVLCEPAARALLALKAGPDAFRAALPAAAGRNRLTLIQALGALRDTASVPALQKLAADTDLETRVAALEALGAINDARAVQTILAACDSRDTHERAKAASVALVLAEGRLAAGDKTGAERAYERIWQTRAGKEDRGVRIAALQGLLETRNQMADLLAAITGADPAVRAAALHLAASGRGNMPTEQVAAGVRGRGDVATRAGYLAVLAARKATQHVDVALAATKDRDREVRVAALDALGTLAGEAQLADVVAILKGTVEPAEMEAARGALSRCCQRGLSGPTADLVVPALAAAQPANAGAMVCVLRDAGGRKSLDAVVASTKSANADLRDTAIGQLCEWRGIEAAPALLEIARAGGEEPQALAAVQGAIRLAGRSGSADEKLRTLEDAMQLARRAAERRQVFVVLRDVRTESGLKMAARYLEDEVLWKDAANAVVTISGEVIKRNKAAVVEPLKKVVEVSQDDRLTKDAQRLLDQAR